ncbi:PIN domain-containing protein [Mesorhizobium sp. WSM4310]|uniref:PIN domain-containing protein n=1 Tax=Mesorhizobium sp. WSM4310 TaxID=2589883 RepID=UPI0024847DDB|nr:PIN domain-containing protein [Mesorhizobium sp. WSM4310]
MYVLDTNVVSELIRKRPHPNVVGWIAESDSSLAIPFGCVIEIQRGITMLQQRDVARSVQLQDWLNRLLRSDMAFLPMDAETSKLYARMTLVPQLKDLWTQPPQAKAARMNLDLAIAASAIVHRAVVATINTKDFLRIDRHFPLPGLFDPASREWSILPKGGRRRPQGAADRFVAVARPRYLASAAPSSLRATL